MIRFLQKYTPALLLGYFLVSCVRSGYVMWKWEVHKMNWKKALILILEKVLFHRNATKMFIANQETFKVTCAVAISPLLEWFMERMNRRRLWSKQRSILIIMSCSFALLMLWHSTLKLITSF
jgi:hypothetical protein